MTTGEKVLVIGGIGAALLVVGYFWYQNNIAAQAAASPLPAATAPVPLPPTSSSVLPASSPLQTQVNATAPGLSLSTPLKQVGIGAALEARGAIDYANPQTLTT